MKKHLLDNYEMREMIGFGAHGKIIVARSKLTNELVAVKSRSVNMNKKERSSLRKEAKIYKKLVGAPGFPICKHYIMENGNESLVMEYLGKNINNLMWDVVEASHIGHLSLKTVLMIADQALSRLQYLHKKGYVHCDVKPENFAVGRKPSDNTLFLIDMGLAKRYTDKKTGEHVPFSDKCSFTGTMKYASINAHRGWKLSRRDDLESLGYTLIYLLTGSLPWATYTSMKDVKNCKMNTSVKYLCDGIPEEFEVFINSVKCLGYSDEPDYASYRKLFRQLFIKNGFFYDYVFDWSKTKITRSFNTNSMSQYKLISKTAASKTVADKNTRSNSPPERRNVGNKKHRLLIYPS